MPSLPSSRSSERLADKSSTRLAPREPREPREREREREPRGGGTQANFSSDRHHRRRDTEFLDQVGATYDTIALSTVLTGIRTLVPILTFLSFVLSLFSFAKRFSLEQHEQHAFESSGGGGGTKGFVFLCDRITEYLTILMIQSNDYI